MSANCIYFDRIMRKLYFMYIYLNPSKYYSWYEMDLEDIFCKRDRYIMNSEYSIFLNSNNVWIFCILLQEDFHFSHGRQHNWGFPACSSLNAQMFHPKILLAIREILSSLTGRFGQFYKWMLPYWYRESNTYFSC